MGPDLTIRDRVSVPVRVLLTAVAVLSVIGITRAPALGAGPHIVVIGDSIVWQATAAIESLVPSAEVDGVIGRSFSQAQSVIAEAVNLDPDVVVIALGTNPTMTAAQVAETMDALSEVPHVVFVNIRIPRSWETSTNALIDSLPSIYVRASVVDWYGFSASRPYLFNSSGFHLADDGIATYAAFVVDSVFELIGSCPSETPYSEGECKPFGRFVDDDRSVFEADIEWLAESEVTRGCNPPVNDRFCPDQPVTRGEFAAMLVRYFEWGSIGAPDRFSDDNASVFEADIDRLAAAGVTKGCNPPINDRFCPDRTVTRGQVAALLVRAFGWTEGADDDRFVDDDLSVFEADIDRLARVDVTRGCNPPVNNRFCPAQKVTRGELAALLHRAAVTP